MKSFWCHMIFFSLTKMKLWVCFQFVFISVIANNVMDSAILVFNINNRVLF